MKNKTLILKVVLPVVIGLSIGRLITPLFNLTSSWANILLSTIITIALIIIIESITIKKTSSGSNIIYMGELDNLHKVKKNEIHKASEVLADAFKNDPLFKALFGDAIDNEKKYFLTAKFMIKYCYKYGEVYASSENFEGIMAITQSKYSYTSLWRIIRSASIFPIISIGFKSFLKIAGALSPIDEIRKKHMKNKAFAYLQIIGVSSNNQGQGYGSKMLREFITKATKTKIPIYLETETESNANLYEHFGFKTLEKINLPIINQPMWIMLREVKIDK